MTRKIFLLALLCGVLPAVLSAQSNWQPAVLTTDAGQQLVGMVDDRRWSFRIRQLRFRPTGQEEVTRYDVADLRAFTVADRRYRVIQAAVNTSPRLTRDLVREEKRTTETSPKALMLLLEGPLSLYEYVDEESNKHYFLGEGTGAPRYLDFGRYLIERRNSKYIYREANAFRAILREELEDCPRLRGEIAQAEYEEASLVSILKRYFSCDNQRATYELPATEGGWSFGPDLGMVRSSPLYGEIDPNAIFFSRLSSWDPIFGGHLRYRFSGLAADVAIRLGAQYHTFTIQESRPDPEFVDTDVTFSDEYFFNERSIHLQLGPEAILVRTRYPVFLESAVHYHRILDYRESRFRQRTENGMTTANGLAYDLGDRGAFSLSIGAGVIAGNARLTFWGSATRRAYETFVLNLYRVGFTGGYDF